MTTLAENSIPEPNSGCLLWLGPVQSSGYGQTRARGRSVLTHRLAWEEMNGPIPAGLVVRHTCDVKTCVNPAHLRVGTQADNIADKVSRGRQDRGEKHGQSKLTADQVLAIRADPRPAREVAPLFGVHRLHINAIRSRRFWGHI